MKWWLFQDDKRNQLAEWGVFLFLGIFLLYFKLNYHEMWKDEWQAWLVARDMSWAEMLGFLYYEGHPALWYVYLKVWTYARSTLSDDLLLQLAHSLPVLAAYALLLFRFSFSIWLKVAVALSYYLFFEYGMVSRGYVFVVFLGFWLALALKNPRKNAPLIALLLLLLCQTEVYGLLIASSLLVYLFFREWLPERPQFTGLIKKREILLPATGALLGFILFLVSVLPLGRSTEGYERKSELFAQLNGDGIAKAFQGLFANTFWIGAFPDTNAFGVAELGLGLSAAVLALLFWLFRRHPVLLFTFGFYTLVYFAFAILVYTGGVRQWGVYFVFWVICLQLWHYHGAKVSWDQLLIVLSICGFQLVYNFKALEKDYQYPFSHARAAAEYLEENLPEDYPVLAISKFAAAPVAGYLGRPLYALPEGELFTYFQWLEKIYLPPESELRLFAQYKKVNSLPILSYQELPASRYPSLELLRKWDGFNLKQENYWLYQLRVNGKR
jgi:hypothetical protein